MIIFDMLASFGFILIILAGYIAIEFNKVIKTGVVMFPRTEIKYLLRFGVSFICIGGIGGLIGRIFF